jgi:hypothetical protein
MVLAAKSIPRRVYTGNRQRAMWLELSRLPLRTSIGAAPDHLAGPGEMPHLPTRENLK